MTRYEKKIFNIINTSHSHMTIDEIYNTLKKEEPKVVLATVYNNLSSLYEQGLISKVSIEGFPDRYDKIKRHDHLVCKRCGKLSDITLRDMTEKLQKEVPVQILSYDLKINYICKECLNKEDEKGGNEK